MEEHQIDSLVQIVAITLKDHSTNKGIQMPSLGAFLSLRDKQQDMTLDCLTQLPQNQLNIIKHLANAYERTLYRQILDSIESQ